MKILPPRPNTTINKKIIDNNLSIKAIIDGEDSIRDMKVIIPNMHPIEAVIWLKKRCTTNDGFPFFVFSPLGVDNIVIRDLDRMLTQTASAIVQMNGSSDYLECKVFSSVHSGSTFLYTSETSHYFQAFKLII